MYKLNQPTVGLPSSSAICLNDGTCFPFACDNTDYQQFKAELADGAELLDADGIVMTQEQVSEFIETLL